MSFYGGAVMLKLYKNKTPNARGGLHYIYNDFNSFLTELGTPFMTVELNDYRITNNTVMITSSTIDQDINDITYAIDERGSYVKCYHVNSSELYSGFAQLNIEVDNWATYFHKATFSKMRVTRTNRNVGIGIYDPIQQTKGVSYVELPSSYTRSTLAIVYVIAQAVGTTSVFGDGTGTRLSIYYNKLSSLPPFNETIYGAIDLIGGLNKLVVSGTTEHKINVLKAYIVPYEALKTAGEGEGYYRFTSQTQSGPVTFSADGELFPNNFEKQFFFTVDPDFNYYFGTKFDGLQLTRTTQHTMQLTMQFITTGDDIKVIAKQGDKMKDITSSFNIGITSNESQLTTGEKIAKGIQTIGQVASGVFQVANGGAGVVTGALQIGGAVTGLFGGQNNPSYTNGGDGYLTFFKYEDHYGVNQPFYLTKYHSCDDENANANLYGASFNQQVPDFETIFNATMLGTGNNETYVAMDLECDGICQNAREFIISEFSGGVHVKQLD